MSQAQIEESLIGLKALVDQIMPLRQQGARLEIELAQVQHDYEQRLGRLNVEAVRLEALRASLRAYLAQQPIHTSQQSTVLPPLDPSPPPQVADEALEPGDMPPPPEDHRAARKRALADHVEYFVADSDRELIMQVINAVLADDRRDIGDMLESLAWGPIWAARADWETLEDQQARLEGWRIALADRVTYWQGEIRRLESDPRYGLLLEKKARSPEDWLAYLDDMAEGQQAEIDTLAYEVVVLEQQWKAKQAESEGSDG